MDGILDRYTPEIGRHFDQTPGPIVLPVGTAPAAPNNWLGINGATVNNQITIANYDWDAIDLMCFANGPFMVKIQAKYRDVSNDFVHGFSVFGTTPGLPFRLFLPFRLEVNDNLTFFYQDISYTANNLVYVTVRGVQLNTINRQ